MTQSLAKSPNHVPVTDGDRAHPFPPSDVQGSAARLPGHGLLVLPLSREDPRGRALVRIGENGELSLSSHKIKFQRWFFTGAKVKCASQQITTPLSNYSMRSTEWALAPTPAEESRCQSLWVNCDSRGELSFVDGVVPIGDSIKLLVERVCKPTNREDIAVVQCARWLPGATLSINPQYAIRCAEHQRKLSDSPYANETMAQQSQRYEALTRLLPSAQETLTDTRSRAHTDIERAKKIVDFLRDKLPLSLPPAEEVFVAPFEIQRNGYTQGCLRFTVSDAIACTDPQGKPLLDKAGRPMTTDLSCIVRIHTKPDDSLMGVELEALFEFGIVLPNVIKRERETGVTLQGRIEADAEYKRTARAFLLVGDFTTPQTNQETKDGGTRDGGLNHIGVSSALLRELTRWNVEHLRLTIDPIGVGEPEIGFDPAGRSEFLLVGYALKQLLHGDKSTAMRFTPLAEKLLPAMHHKIPVTAEEITLFAETLTKDHPYQDDERID